MEGGHRSEDVGAEDRHVDTLAASSDDDGAGGSGSSLGKSPSVGEVEDLPDGQDDSEQDTEQEREPVILSTEMVLREKEAEAEAEADAKH